MAARARAVGGEARFGEPIPMHWACAHCGQNCPEPLRVCVHDERISADNRGGALLHHTTVLAMKLHGLGFYGPYCSDDCYAADIND